MKALKGLARSLEPLEKLLTSLSLAAAFCFSLLFLMNWVLSQGL
jgi:hypothetical protein